MSYLEGKGTNKDIDEAIKWLYKAAGHDAGNQRNTAQTDMRGAVIKELTTLDGTVFTNAKVEKAEPDGIQISYKAERGGFGMATLKFRDLPGDVQKAFAYDPQAETGFVIRQLATEELGYAEAVQKSAERKTERSEIIRTLSRIVSNYHETHTYLTNEAGNNIYVCGDMACDVWDMVIAKGIDAKIVVGNIKEDIASIAQANHAWVLAEISDGEWLALETTGGFTVRMNGNKRYFFGCKFSTARDYRDFEHLQRQYNEALSKGRAASDSYNSMATAYNSADIGSRMSLRPMVQQQAAVLKDRLSDLKQLKEEVDAFCLTGD
jgi:hypothetical protein